MTSIPVKIAFVATVLTAALILLSKAGPVPAQQAASMVATVSGRVVDAQEQPVSGVMVSAEPVDVVAVSKKFYYTDEQGEFIIPDLPAGKYILHTRDEDTGYPRSEFNLYDIGDSLDPTIEVQPAPSVQNVTLRLGQKAARLAGRVFDAATHQPLKGADITVRRVDLPERFLSTGLFCPGVPGGFNVLVPSLPLNLKVSRAGYEDWNYVTSVKGRESGVLIVPSGSTKSLLIALKPLKQNTAR